jgi:hypothetical protein
MREAMMRRSTRAFDGDGHRHAPLTTYVVAVLLFAGATHSASAQRLEGRAVLPADTG